MRTIEEFLATVSGPEMVHVRRLMGHAYKLGLHKGEVIAKSYIVPTQGLNDIVGQANNLAARSIELMIMHEGLNFKIDDQ